MAMTKEERLERKRQHNRRYRLGITANRCGDQGAYLGSSNTHIPDDEGVQQYRADAIAAAAAARKKNGGLVRYG